LQAIPVTFSTGKISKNLTTFLTCTKHMFPRTLQH
jgi:hypothetical protein